MLRVLVCGSRTWTDAQRIHGVLRDLNESPLGPIDVVIDGSARGADAMAHDSAIGLGLKTLRFPANWKLYGRRAGAIRNLQMLSEGLPDLVLAFWDGVSRGTGHMIELARSMKIPVEVHRA